MEASSQNITPEKLKNLSSEIISPFTDDNVCNQNNFRSSLSTNNTMSSPRSKEIVNEIFDNLEIENGLFNKKKNSYLLINQENRILSDNMSINEEIDELVIQRLNHSKRKRIKRTVTCRNISPEMNVETSQKNVSNIRKNDENTRNYQNITKYSSLIDTNSEEFNEMPHSMQKKILQMIRNRQSAQKHRDKQKIERQNLIQENISLRARVVELTNELQEMRSKTISLFEHQNLISQIKNGYKYPDGINNQYINNSENNEMNHRNVNLDNIKNRNKAKIEVGGKGQEINCAFDFVSVDDYSNMGIWNPICDANNNINRNESICNHLNIHPSIDALPWIGGPVNTWNKQNNDVEDLLISTK